LNPTLTSCSTVGLEYQLTAVSQKVHPSSSAFNKTGSASSRLKLLPKPKLKPIAPKPGDGTLISPKGIVLTIVAGDEKTKYSVIDTKIETVLKAWLYMRIYDGVYALLAYKAGLASCRR
jgi:hypothetical protein